MSYNSLYTQVQDGVLMGRLNAAAMKEALANPTFGDTDFGRAITEGRANAVQVLAWPLCIDTEEQYEYALDQNNPNPGGDEGVITDAQIGSAVQVHWPPDPWPPTPIETRAE
jgi:hypothetical protein